MTLYSEESPASQDDDLNFNSTVCIEGGSQGSDS